MDAACQTEADPKGESYLRRNQVKSALLTPLDHTCTCKVTPGSKSVTRECNLLPQV